MIDKIDKFLRIKRHTAVFGYLSQFYNKKLNLKRKKLVVNHFSTQATKAIIVIKYVVYHSIGLN